MGIPVATILKGIDLVFAGLQAADKVITKVSLWRRKRAIMKAIKKKVNKS